MASTSKIVEVEESLKLLESFTSLELSDKEAKADCKKEKYYRLQLEKKFANSLDKGKGKGKESVHPAPINKDAGNVKVFEEIPIEEQLNWGTDSAGDDHSDLDDEIVESAGLDTGMYHTSHLYNDNYTDGPC